MRVRSRKISVGSRKMRVGKWKVRIRSVRSGLEV